MKRACFILLSIVTISLLMNFPDCFSGWNNSSVTTRAAARPFPLSLSRERGSIVAVYGDEQIGFPGKIVKDKLWFYQAYNPEAVAEQPITGLQPGESVSAIEAIPNPNGLNCIAENGPPLTISAITDQGNLYNIDCYNIDCETGNAVFVALIQALKNNERLSYTFNPDTGTGLVLDPDAGMQLAFNPFTGQVLETGPVNFFYAQGDANEGKTPKVIEWYIPSPPDYDNDGDLDILFYDENQRTVGKIGGGGSLNTLHSLDILDFVSMDFARSGDGPTRGYVLNANNDLGGTSFGAVNLNTGKVTDLGSLGDGTKEVTDFVALAPPIPLCVLIPNQSRLPIGSTATGTIEPNIYLIGGIDATDVYALGVTGPNAGAIPQVTVDSNGQIAFRYTSNGQPGTDTIQATATFDSIPFSCAVTVEWKEFLITNVKNNKGKTGENIVVSGINFQQGDIIFINGEQAQKTKFKAGSGKLVAKNGERLLNPCTGGVPAQNEIKVFRNPLGGVGQSITDTTAFATCP